jgi:hypothetical protein
LSTGCLGEAGHRGGRFGGVPEPGETIFCPPVALAGDEAGNERHTAPAGTGAREEARGPRGGASSLYRPPARKATPMFTVNLSSESIAELYDAWVDRGTATRVELESALAVLCRLLQQDPAGHGESRGGRERVVFADGVAATYELCPERRIVRVLRAWAFRRGR